MKATKQLLFLITILTISFCGISFGQTTHVITLNVDEDGTFSLSADADTEVVDDSSLENFTILVFEDDEVEWEGNAASEQALGKSCLRWAFFCYCFWALWAGPSRG